MKSNGIEATLNDLYQDDAFLKDLARRLLKDQESAEDLRQETWLRWLKRAPRSISNPRAFLARITFHTMLSRRRRESRRKELETTHSPRTHVPTPEEVLHRETIRRELAEVVLSLPDSYRSPLLLLYYRGLSERDAARNLGIPVETLRTRRRRGLEQMREILTKSRGGTGWIAALSEFSHPYIFPWNVLAWAGAVFLVSGVIVVVWRMQNPTPDPLQAWPDPPTSQLEEPPILTFDLPAAINNTPSMTQPDKPRIRLRGRRVQAPLPFAEPMDPAGKRLLTATRVVDAVGRPISGADVRVIHEAKFPLPDHWDVITSELSGRDGFVHLATGAADRRIDGFIVLAPQHAPHGDFGGHPGEEMVLYSGLDVPIRLVDALLRPVAHADVQYILGCGHTPNVLRTSTGADGTALVKGVVPKEGELWCVGEGIQAEAHTLPYWRPGDPPVLLIAPIGRTVRGILENGQGEPLAGFYVGCPIFHRGPWTRSDSSGSFVLKGANFGDRIVLYDPLRLSVPVAELEFLSRDIERINLDLKALPPDDTLAIRVDGSKSERPLITLRLSPVILPPEMRLHVVAEGREINVSDEAAAGAEIKNLNKPAGLRFSWHDLHFAVPFIDNTDFSKPVDVHLPEFNLPALRVLVRTSDGTPLPAYACFGSAKFPMNRSEVLETSEDEPANDTWELPRLLPGPVALYVVPEDSRFAPVRRIVSDDEVEVILTTPSIEQSTLRIINRAGLAVADAVVSLDAPFELKGQSDKNGYVRFPWVHLEDGQWLKIEAGGYLPRRVCFSSNEKTCILDGSRIDLILRTHDGPAPKDTVIWIDGFAIDHESKGLRLDGFPKGTHQLLVGAPGYWTEITDFYMPDSGEVKAEVILELINR